MVNMSVDTWFVGISSLRAETFTMKDQICACLQARALGLWHERILEAHQNLKLKVKKVEKLPKG